MNQTKPDFKVFVSDEILDFRTLESKRKGNNSYNTSKPYSQSIINLEQISEPNERQISSLERFSKSLYNNSTGDPTQQRFPKKSKQKSRSKTVDPRFRRSRSPSYKLTTSQSTANLSEVSMPQSESRKKSHSASYLHISRDNHENSKQPQSNTNTDAHENVNLNEEPTEPTPVALVKNEELKSCDKDEKSVHILKSYVNDDDEFEEGIESLLLDYDDDNEEPKENYNASPNPYWDDPRLLAKHSILRKPATMQRIRSSMTVPVIPRSSVVSSKGIVICRNCLSYQRNTREYDFDEPIDAYPYSHQSFIAQDDDFRQFYFKSKEHSMFAFFMALGSITGIFVVSIIGWLLFSKFSWDLSKYIWIGGPSVPEENIFMLYIKSIGTAVVEGIDTIFSNLYKLLSLSGADIFNLNPEANEPSPSAWWQNIL